MQEGMQEAVRVLLYEAQSLKALPPSHPQACEFRHDHITMII
jgi:hypothetical protein